MAKKKKAVRTAKKKTTPLVKKDRWDIRRIYLPIGIAALALLVSSQVTYTQSFQRDILGDEDDAREQQEKQQEEQSKAQEEQQKEAAKQAEEAAKRQEEQERETSQNSGSGNTNTQERETETETPDGAKVKTKVEDDGATKVEIEEEGFHFKFEGMDGKIRLRVTDGEGNEIRTRERLREIDELEQELEDEEIEIASTDGHLEIEHNAVRARVNFPLSIDPISRDLIVTTPAGERTVAVLPDAAVRNLLAKGFLSQVAPGAATPGASDSAQFAGSVELAVENGNLVYEVRGTKHERFLGLVPVALQRTVSVSALTGAVLSQRETLLSTILGFFSF